MDGWFELIKSSDNQFRFVLKAGNGETILTSELYTSKASAEKGIASVRSNSPQEERYEKKSASNGAHTAPFCRVKKSFKSLEKNC